MAAMWIELDPEDFVDALKRLKPDPGGWATHHSAVEDLNIPN